MNTAKQATVLSADDAELLEICFASARAAVSRVLFSASMVKEGAVTPNWDTDLADPAMAINQALCHIESALNLDTAQKARETAKRFAGQEASVES